MNNKLILKDIIIKKNRIEYSYEVMGYWKRYFQLDAKLYVEYNLEIEKNSYELAVIPFLYVFMPLAWMFQASVELDIVGEETLKGLEKYRQELKKIYPKIRFYKTNIIAKVVSEEQKNRENTAVYFSGGVDAWATLLEHLDKTPYLVTVIGADVDVNNADAASKVWNETRKVADDFSLASVKIETNMRLVINESKMHRYLHAKEGIGYWQGIAAGIGIIGLAAPLSEKLSICKVYVSTSITNEQVSMICRDGIIGQFVNALGWSGTIIKAYGETTSRQEKIEKITAFSKQNKTPIYIRACWRDKRGKNCCKCEKCYRTMVGIAVERESPKDYGFDVGKCFLLTIGIRLKNILKQEPRKHEREMPCCYWTDIQRHYRGNIWYLNWLKRLSF